MHCAATNCQLSIVHFINSNLVILRQSLHQRSFHRKFYHEFQTAILGKILCNNLRIEILEAFHHKINLVVCERQRIRCINRFLHNLCIVQRIGSCCAIGIYQSRNAKFCPTEIPHDHNHRISKPKRTQLSQHGHTRTIGRLTVVAAAVVVSIVAKHKGIHMMSGIVVLLLHSLQVFPNLVFGAHRKRQRDELAALLGIESFRVGNYGLICIDNVWQGEKYCKVNKTLSF